ncbi:MAG: uncharacterized protein QOI74_1000 [Micromonosporaceae bacterium]|jgi:uncharacterized membrane protein YfcA|nr:uncharacterized protein [Micromonosporaceae bacterium]
MDAGHIAPLVAAGLAAGTVNSVAGGGSLVSFPALLASGLSPVAANVTNSIAVFPGYLGSVAGSRDDLAALGSEIGRRRIVALLPTTAVGTAAGCALLLATPARAFDLVVPFLVLGAAAVLAAQNRLRALAQSATSPRRHTVAPHLVVLVGSVYGGYFGAALGIMLVAALGLVLPSRLVRISALKNLLSALVGLITLIVFAVFGPVNWVDVAILAPATVTGGYVGARLARRLPAPVLRAVIVTFAGVVGLILLVRAVR